MATSHNPMLLIGLLISLACIMSLTKLLMCVFAQSKEINLEDFPQVFDWLKENNLEQYHDLFKERGKWHSILHILYMCV